LLGDEGCGEREKQQDAAHEILAFPGDGVRSLTQGKGRGPNAPVKRGTGRVVKREA